MHINMFNVTAIKWEMIGSPWVFEQMPNWQGHPPAPMDCFVLDEKLSTTDEMHNRKTSFPKQSKRKATFVLWWLNSGICLLFTVGSPIYGY